MLTTAEKLARIKNYHTRYEIILAHANYPSILVAYTSRKSFHGLLAAVRERGPKIVALLGVTDEHKATRERTTLHLGNGWLVRFSGRTQRDAILNGERPFVGTIEKLDFDPSQECVPAGE